MGLKLLGVEQVSPSKFTKNCKISYFSSHTSLHREKLIATNSDLKNKSSFHSCCLMISRFRIFFFFYFILFFSFIIFLFSVRVFFNDDSRIKGLQGKGRGGISLTPHYHFHPLQRHLDISRAITAESSPLHIASSRTRTGNLWFPSASR